MKLRYFWPGMSADVRSYLRGCDVCARRKSPAKKRVAPLQQYPVGVPMERVAIDLLGPLPMTDNGNRLVLVIGDNCVDASGRTPPRRYPKRAHKLPLRYR